MIPSLLELTTQLRKSTTKISKNESYSLLLELFLSIEDGKCGTDVDLKGVFVQFEEFAATTMTADLIDKSTQCCHDIILQIIALSFSNISLWSKNSITTLGLLLRTVCDIILREDMNHLLRESPEEVIVLTALFSLDNFMPTLMLQHHATLVKVFNHVLLLNANENTMTRVYAYRALRRFTTCVLCSSLDAAEVAVIVSSIKVTIFHDITHSDLELRRVVSALLESLPVVFVKSICSFSEVYLRKVLQFLRYHTIFVLK